MGLNHFSQKLNQALAQSALSLAAVLVLLPNAAQAKTCSDLFFLESKTAVPVADLNIQLRDHYEAHNVKAFDKVEILRGIYPKFAEHKALNNALDQVLADESLSSFHILLRKISMKTINLRTDGHLSKDSSPSEVLNAFVRATEVELMNFMPKYMAEERAKILKQENLDKALLMRALGRMSVQESNEALVGPKGIHDVHPDSLVGRFMKSAKAAGSDVSSVITNFRKGPRSSNRGPERLFISLDSKSRALANRIFGQNPHLLIHNHDESQGTLELYHYGHAVTYASYANREALSPRGNTILPLIALSSVEASNTINYFELGSMEMSRAKYPWGLKDTKDKDSIYCRVGGYSSCTHWVGEMPIGEKRVTEYTFPGRGADQYSDSHATRDPLARSQSAIRTSKIGSYDAFVSRTQTYPIGTEARIDRLTRIVWNENVGREQFWGLIGPEGKDSLKKGEFANPGWVLYHLLGKASQERVPVVLVYREWDFTKLDVEAIEDLKSTINPQ